MLDSPGPGYLPPPFVDDADAVSELVRDWLAIAADELRGQALARQLELVLDRAARAGAPLAFSTVEQGLRLHRVWRASFEALHAYAAPPWPHGELQYFRAAERGRQPANPELAWIGRCARVTVEVAPGGHASMLLPPHAEPLGARIRACIERSRAAIELPVVRGAPEPVALA
jgi:thioesterase domain-containing protein